MTAARHTRRLAQALGHEAPHVPWAHGGTEVDEGAEAMAVADDRAWFAAHPDETERVRPLVPGELELPACQLGADAAVWERLVALAPASAWCWFGGSGRACARAASATWTPTSRRSSG